MRTFNKQAVSLKKNLKQDNLMPLFVVFSVIVMLSLTYKSVSKVTGVGNTMFKEGNRNRRRRVRQGFREGSDHDEDDDDDDDAGEIEERFTGKEAMGQSGGSGFLKEEEEGAPEGFLNGGGIGRKAGSVRIEGMKGIKGGRRGGNIMKGPGMAGNNKGNTGKDTGSEGKRKKDTGSEGKRKKDKGRKRIGRGAANNKFN